MPGKSDIKNGLASPSKNERFLDSVDPDDPDYIRDLQRPAAIKEDLNEMERRKRVRQILESRAFKQELEELILHEKQAGNNADNLQHLEELSELIIPKSHLTHAAPVGFGATQAVIPVADVRGADLAKYGKQERLLRNKLASLYRLVDLFHWSQGIYNHITLRISQDTDHILINPFGLLYHEITASSLIKVDYQGTIIDEGSSKLGINEAGYVLHSAIHQARPDVRCVIHLHTPVVGAVSAMKCGLLPISQEAMIIGPVSYREYRGIESDDQERESIARDLGPNNKIMLLRNHGFVACGESAEETFHLAYNLILACETQAMFVQNNGFIVCGETIEEAFFLAKNLINACEAQIRAARAGIENLVIPNVEAQAKAHSVGNKGGGGVNKLGDKTVHWKVGELEWEAWMRVLDNAGFRTGHLYRQPLLRGKNASAGPQSDVEVPPSSSAYGLLDELGEPSLSPHKLQELKRQHEKARWLNSPNAYQKIEIAETGTNDPKKITKWVAETGSSPVHSTPIKIESSHQFSPLSQNPKEFKERQQQLKEARRQDKVTAGPQSHILDGTTWEEASKLKDAQVSASGDHVIVVGAASKGIIQRDHQHNAQIYRQLYQPNPFANETDDDLEAYKREILNKQKGVGSADSADFEPFPGVHRGEISTPHSAESCSLMQLKPDISVTGLTHETTFDATTDAAITRLTEKKKGYFRRAKSERFPAHQRPKADGVNVNGDRAAASDEEAAGGQESPDKKKEKKKKFKTPSFLKRKKDKKKCEDQEND